MSQVEVEDEIMEHHDPPEVFEEKMKKLVDLVKSSSYIVAFTGAGISASAGIETYRGPNGFWTRRDKGLPPPKSLDINLAKPTNAHMALVGLVRAGKVTHVVSTNVDGLHRKSGLSEDELSELHGNCFKENCSSCGKEYLRDHDVMKSGRKLSDHRTGRKCPVCAGDLRDNVVHFGENLPEWELEKANFHSSLGDLALVLGTSMKVTPACDIPEAIWTKPYGAMVIVNLQKTSFDNIATLRIFAETDKVLSGLMEALQLEIPPNPYE